MRYETDESILGKEFKVLDKGFIQLVDYMGNDQKIVDAARVSYGAGTKSISEDETLIRYLMRHRHTSPFEQCIVSLRVKVPMDTWRQWIRHRTASVNEYSTRYSVAIDDKQETDPDKWRLQDTKINKQGSEGYLPEHIENNNKLGELAGGDLLSIREKELHDIADLNYKYRLKCGVAREQARKDLPLSTYTLAVWTIDLHNLLHFLSLRMDSHAQLEIRQYANIIGNEIVAKLFPLTWSAFQDYKLNAITLTVREIKIINAWNGKTEFNLVGGHRESQQMVLSAIADENWFGWFDKRKDGTLKDNLERIEFEEKAKLLGIELPWLNGG